MGIFAGGARCELLQCRRGQSEFRLWLARGPDRRGESKVQRAQLRHLRPGTSAHLAGELFNSLAGVKMTAVHYKGAAPAITDLLGGTIEVMFTTVASATSLI